MSTPITAMAKEYAVLSAGGGGITVAGADMTPGMFSGIAWSDISFVDCVFGGDGNVALAAMSGCKFMNCRFTGPDHDFGVMTAVKFMDCSSQGRSVFCGRDGSSDVLFQNCSFNGGSAAPQSFRGIGCTGEVVFRNCTGSGEVLVGGTAMSLEGCRFSDMSFVIGRRAGRGAPLAATLVIDGCQGSGLWRMVEGRMKTSHIRNSRFGRIVNDGSECAA